MPQLSATMSTDSAAHDSCSTERLPSPAELARIQPLSASAELHVREVRGRVRRRLNEGRGPLLAIVGPCSIHSEAAALAYAELLEPVARRLEDDVIVVLRAYFEKPRTTVGWKGFLYDPDLDGGDDLRAGLIRARALLVTLAQAKLALATEILDPLVARYFEQQLSWVAIGARTTESQIHRQVASRLACTVGFKNGTDGSVDGAISALLAARSPHTFLGVDERGQISVQNSAGNDSAHVVLRGGKSGPNSDPASIGRVAEALVAQGLSPRVLVDCSHGNSHKDHRRQPEVARRVLAQLDRPDADILGIMLESHVREGRQEATPSARADTSVTDACVDFAATEALLEEMALTHRRRAPRD